MHSLQNTNFQFSIFEIIFAYFNSPECEISELILKFLQKINRKGFLRIKFVCTLTKKILYALQNMENCQKIDRTLIKIALTLDCKSKFILKSKFFSC